MVGPKKTGTAKPKAPRKRAAKKPASRKSSTETKVAAEGKTSVENQPLAKGPDADLGQVLALMIQSPAHKHMFVGDMEWLALPPILLKQYRIYKADGIPVGYAAWAFLSEEVEERLKQGVRKLAPTDWRSGDRPWLIDVVAPFVSPAKILDDLVAAVFPKTGFMTLLPGKDGKLKIAKLEPKKEAEGKETK